MVIVVIDDDVGRIDITSFECDVKIVSDTLGCDVLRRISCRFFDQVVVDIGVCFNVYRCLMPWFYLVAGKGFGGIVDLDNDFS